MARTGRKRAARMGEPIRTRGNPPPPESCGASVGSACAHRRAPSPPRRSRASSNGSTSPRCAWTSSAAGPVLVEFWDFCRVNSLRTLPYLSGVARALRGRRAARDRHPHRRLRPRPRHRRRARRGRAARDRVPGRDRRAAGAVGLLRQRGLAGALPVGPAAARSTRCTTARAPTRRPSARSRRCSASSASSLPPVRPEDEDGVLLPAQTADQPGAYSGPYEAGAVWAVLEGAGIGAGERPRDRRRGARRVPARRARAPHARRARARGRPRRDLPRHLLHPRAALTRRPQLVVPAVAEQADQLRRAAVLDAGSRCRASRATGSARR